MKLKFALLASATLMLTLFSACKKNEEVIEKNLTAEFESNEYNWQMNDLAKNLSKAINQSPEFRKILKKEALKKFDGDYDILLKTISEKPLTSTSANNSSRSVTSVKDFINSYYLEDSENSNTQRKGVSPLDELISQYPDLQVSVPVNAEKWDEDSYAPAVTFIPLEFQDGITEAVIGYNSLGQEIVIDAINEPEEAVIVISQNERVREPIDIGDVPILVVDVPEPTNLTGGVTESGISINWTMPSNTSTSNTTGYYIYRRRSNESSYQKVSTVYGVNNRGYNDVNIVSSATYSYYVQAYYVGGNVSDPSNYITVVAPPRPASVSSFEAIQQSKNEIELRWTNPNDQYFDYTSLSRKIVGQNSNYVEINQFGANDNDYFDFNFPLGKKILYKVENKNSVGTSAPKYDFVITPYRDISKISNVYIKKIVITEDLNRIEGWLKGAPEFYIKVLNVDQLSKTPYEIQKQIDIDFTKRSGTSQDLSNYVMGWTPGFWYDMVTFSVEEYDKPSAKYVFTLSAGYNNKDSIAQGLSVAASAQATFEFEDKGEYCGTSFLSYYENPEKWLYFPSYGVKILVSENK
jgi:hypothetical protein